MGFGNQVGSTNDHLQLLPTKHTEWSKYDEGRAESTLLAVYNENMNCYEFWSKKYHMISMVPTGTLNKVLRVSLDM